MVLVAVLLGRARGYAKVGSDGVDKVRPERQRKLPTAGQLGSGLRGPSVEMVALETRQSAPVVVLRRRWQAPMIRGCVQRLRHRQIEGSMTMRVARGRTVQLSS